MRHHDRIIVKPRKNLLVYQRQVIHMPVKVLNFSELKKKLDASNREAIDLLVKKLGTAYIVAVTREKCPSCENQKPLFEKLSREIDNNYARNAKFFRVHSRFSKKQTQEARQCLDAFHTIAFPTYIIAIKDKEGNSRETYRALEPPMNEIERNIKLSVEVAKRFTT